MKNSILKFIIVGSIGFVIDVSILYLCIHFLETNLVVSRIISFSIAVIITWLLNRVYTFKMSTPYKKRKHYFMEFFKYLIGSSISISINFGVYMFVISFFSLALKTPILAVAIGSISAMFFSYIFSKYYIFTRDLNEK